MALAHGLGKTPPPEQLIDGVANMGFPMAIVFAWAASRVNYWAVSVLQLASTQDRPLHF